MPLVAGAGFTPEMRAKAAATRVARAVGLRRDFADACEWDRLASKYAVRQPAWTEPVTTGSIRRWCKRLGIATEAYLSWWGGHESPRFPQPESRLADAGARGTAVRSDRTGAGRGPAEGRVTAAGLVQSEKDFQAQLITLAKLYGWLTYHTHDSRKSAAGWPDLAFCRPPRLLLVECKTDTGTVDYYQRQWLTALEACPGVETYIWRPAMWPEITRILA